MNGPQDSTPTGPVPDGTFVIIAAFNEERVIADVIRGVLTVCSNVVLVDDGSRDATATRARELTPHVLRHMVNRGQGAALQTGIEYALRKGASYLVTFDADGQHSPDDIPRLLAPILNNEAQIALGSRFLGDAPNMPTSRRLILRAAILFTRLVNRMPLTDAHNGLRALSRDAATGINLRADRMAHASEILDQIRDTGLPYVEVPVRINYTEYSLAKGQTSRGAFRILFHYLVGKVMGD